MPKGPRGEKRPADAVGLALSWSPRSPRARLKIKLTHYSFSAAAELGRKGGKARAKKLTAQQRSEIASKAAKKRWKPES